MFNPGVWKDDSVPRHKGPSSTTVTATRTTKIRKTTFLCVQHAFFVHFFAFTARVGCEKCLILRFMKDINKQRRNFLLFLKLNSALGNLTPGEFAYIWKSKWLGIIAMKIERTWTDIFSEVFAAAVLGLRGRIFATLGPLDSVVVQCILWSVYSVTESVPFSKTHTSYWRTP